MKNNNNNKAVFVVIGANSIVGIYSTREKAEKARDNADTLDSLSGGKTFFYIKEIEVDKEG